METTLLKEFIREELCDIAGHEAVVTSKAELFTYGADYFWIPRVWMDRGAEPMLPDYLVTADTVEKVSAILKLANRYKIPVIPYAGGTGVNGGIIAVHGGIMLDIKNLNQLVEIDDKSLTVTAQAGINGQLLEWELNRRGLTLAHYPASQYGATLGGYVAARGSGTLSTKYGKAEDMVLRMEVVLPSGEVIETLPVPSHSTGPNLHHLFMGTEGTYGVITELTMRVDPLPEVREFQGYLFDDLETALEAGRLIMAKRLNPCTIRLYDPPSTVRFIKGVLGIDVEGSFLVIGCDGSRGMVDLQKKEIDAICTSMKGKDIGPEPGEIWWRDRYKFYFPPFCPNLPELFGTMDSVTTFDKIYDLYKAKRKAIEGGYKDFGARYTAHFSHWFPWGVMIYDRFFVEKPPHDPREALQLHNRMWADGVRASLATGGVINEHHGIGLKLGSFMPEQYGASWPVLTGIKKMLDPNNIMNPGKLGF